MQDDSVMFPQPSPDERAPLPRYHLPTLLTPLLGREQVVTRRWEALCAVLPPDACIYTVSMDPPQVQARWQDRTGVLHQALSAHHSVQFGQDYGVWLKEWHLLQRSVVVIDRTDRIVYVEYVTDQISEPDYTAALHAVQRAAGQ